MWLRIFMPTPRRLLLFLIFLVLTVSGTMAIVPPFQNLFGFPYLLLSGYYGIVAQLIYSYAVACIYASAYVRLEAGIRRSYPNMNGIVQKHAPSSQPPVVQEPEPPPSHTVQVVHPARKPARRKARARLKKEGGRAAFRPKSKAAKRRKR